MDAHRFSPRRPARPRLWWWLLPLLLVLLIVLPAITYFTIDWLWFSEMARLDVYWTMVWGKWLFGLVVGAAFFLLVFANVYLALRQTSDTAWVEIGQRLRANMLALRDRTLRRIAFWGSAALTLLLALSMARAAESYWPQFLLFSHAQQVGRTDPIFHRDVGFYLFRLPVWELAHQWLFTTLIIAVLLTGAIYLLMRVFRGGEPAITAALTRHLSLLFAALLVVKAVGYYLGRFSLLATENGNIVGPGYTDIHARIPGLAIMAVLTLVAAVVVLVALRRRDIVVPVGVLIALVVASILTLGAYPALLQSLRVNPNQLALESPYLRHHIDMTRTAYGLNAVREVKFSPISPRVERAQLSASPVTVNNIRLWDHRPLLQTFQQLQGLRPYYHLTDVDIDRYQLDGQQRQVMLSARELDPDRVPGQQVWQNRHLFYTHGYGVVMSPVNEVANKGEPVFFIRDIPPVATNPALKVTRPGIYFGEIATDYAVVKTKLPEFDYPQGEDNAQTQYAGAAGIPLRNPLVRAVMALEFNSLNLMISDYITPQSRIIIRRQIIERTRSLAPFLRLDRDPYIVVGTDGHLYWMLDAYTHSTLYPYAQHALLQTAQDGEVRVNYLRNPVKVVIDAYSGATGFYVADPDEPIIRAWQAVFPRVFQPLSAMPAGLQAHVRMPEGMFNTQSAMYTRYHMQVPTTFFTREDLWEIPEQAGATDVSGQPMSGPIEAYYLVMTLPGRREPEYLLIRPYTPAGKQNMIAWLSAGNDPDHYGELVVFNFPKQSLIYGPAQVGARINQDTEISQRFTLWGQVGSRVWKGNLMVIPIGNSILYVQPIYLLAEQSQIPELQQVIVADQERVFMTATIEQALSALAGGTLATTRPPAPAAAPPVRATATPAGTAAIPTPAQRTLARSALEHYQRAQEALKRGDWTTYGTEIEAVRRDLEELNK